MASNVSKLKKIFRNRMDKISNKKSKNKIKRYKQLFSKK